LSINNKHPGLTAKISKPNNNKYWLDLLFVLKANQIAFFYSVSSRSKEEEDEKLKVILKNQV
jgi:hypothetical protein